MLLASLALLALGLVLAVAGVLSQQPAVGLAGVACWVAAAALFIGRVGPYRPGR